MTAISTVMQRGWRERLQDHVDAVEAADGPDMKAISRKAGLSPGYVHSILKQGRTPSIESFLKVAAAYGVEPGWLLLGDERFQIQFPVIGRAVEGESWQPVGGARMDKATFEPGADAFDMVVCEVIGDANAPAYRDRDVLYCSRHAGPNLHNFILGRDCLVKTKTGECYIKHVLDGERPGSFTLRSINNPVAKGLRNVALEWAAPIKWIRRGDS